MPDEKPKPPGWRIPEAGGKGTKVGRTLRRDVKHLFHELFEKASLLRELDPSFDEELERLQLGTPMTTLKKAIAAGKRRGKVG